MSCLSSDVALSVARAAGRVFALLPTQVIAQLQDLGMVDWTVSDHSLDYRVFLSERCVLNLSAMRVSAHLCDERRRIGVFSMHTFV